MRDRLRDWGGEKKQVRSVGVGWQVETRRESYARWCSLRHIVGETQVLVSGHAGEYVRTKNGLYARVDVESHESSGPYGQ